ncbi:hypothetical protein, partial [Nocardia nova]|uniref:hypothetical protein n=1 Tax=Nocardia nova TaxID=37330 RepID=UPI0025AF39F0
ISPSRTARRASTALTPLLAPPRPGRSAARHTGSPYWVPDRRADRGPGLPGNSGNGRTGPGPRA